MNIEPDRSVIELHLGLQGFHAGLSMNVSDPVAVPSGIPLARFASIYYDCTEDENEGIAIMQQRKDRHGQTVERFLEYHARMVEQLATIEEYANVGNSPNARTATAAFLRHYRDYVEFLHQFRSSPETATPFLDFPSAPVTSLSRQYLSIREFNPTRDYSGAVREAARLERILSEIEPHHILTFGQLAPVAQPYSSGTWMDGSYRGRLEFTKKMWEDFKSGVQEDF
jgi:hypothetical protein